MFAFFHKTQPLHFTNYFDYNIKHTFQEQNGGETKSEKDTANFEFLSLLYGVLSLLDSKQSLNFLCNKETKNGNVLRQPWRTVQLTKKMAQAINKPD